MVSRADAYVLRIGDARGVGQGGYRTTQYPDRIRALFFLFHSCESYLPVTAQDARERDTAICIMESGPTVDTIVPRRAATASHPPVKILKAGDQLPEKSYVAAGN